MILLSIIVAALGVITLVLLLFVMWPPPRQERRDAEHLDNLRPLGNVDRLDKETP